VINVNTGNGSYGVTNGACFRASLNVPVAVVPAAWQLTDAAERPHVMAAQLKRTTDVFPSSIRGTDPPV
jgi:hypothetical protein